MDSTPGNCQFKSLGSTNKDIFKYEAGICDPERVAMVRCAVKSRLDRLIAGYLEADTINVFVKPEPHTTAKLTEGRLRLISAVSLVDTMIDRVLFGWVQRKALTVVGRTPCLCGWSPMVGGWRYIYGRFRNQPVLCLDKSSWDWTVQEHVVIFWKRFLSELAVGHRNWWTIAASARFEVLFKLASFQFKDGTVVQQEGTGIMKSGCLLTLILNSVGQSYLHYLSMLRIGRNPLQHQPICVGDDTVQTSFEDIREYVYEMEKLGAVVKGVKIRNWVEFCGFAFAKETCVPAYWQKHLFKLQYCKLEDSLASYQMIYANEPVMYDLLYRLAMQVNPELVITPVEAKLIMNG
ncbi:hypothetical protein 2 [Hubei sobemo-like virus 9]|uniref:hypothetical protein 2 n=1 Tax=Hubei sobemo-like virus 9 TaxID=1923242 RepID=UPI00090C635C|nr:hypothetical protein 2 [Hubei sobemo-like virus 9]APG75828.1 hypothetical protein 2 [Hubei sobemo-like virus 9]